MEVQQLHIKLDTSARLVFDASCPAKIVSDQVGCEVLRPDFIRFSRIELHITLSTHLLTIVHKYRRHSFLKF